MTNYYEKLKEIDAVDPILVVVFNDKLRKFADLIGDIIPEGVPALPEDKIGVELTFEEARPYLDYEIGYLETWGYQRFAAWTADRVITVFGDIPTIIALPRNPGAVPEPEILVAMAEENEPPIEPMKP